MPGLADKERTPRGVKSAACALSTLARDTVVRIAQEG